MEGLLEARQGGRLAVGEIGVAGREQHRQLGAERLQLRRELGAAHAGHGVVGDDEIDALLALQQLERAQIKRGQSKLKCRAFIVPGVRQNTRPRLNPQLQSLSSPPTRAARRTNSI